MPETQIVVHSKHAVELRLHRFVEVVPGLGIKESRPTGDAVELRAGRNEVGAEFWREWATQNAGTPLLASLVVEQGESRHAV